MNHTLHRILQLSTALLLFAFVILLSGVLMVRSGWFRERVRERIVSELESATGARVELANFDFDWTHFTASVAPLVLHGKESAAEQPLAKLESLTLGLRVISPLERRVDLSSLRVVKPQVHIIIYADGSTNLPAPPQPPSGNAWTKNLVDLAVRHYEIADGVLEVDARRYPLQVRGEDLILAMDYRTARLRGANYKGTIASRQISFSSEDAVPTSASLNGAFLLDATHVEFSKLRLASGQSRADLSGSFTNPRSPKGRFTVKAVVAASDLTPYFPETVAVKGAVNFDGDLAVALGEKFDYTISGRVNTRDASFARGRISLPAISVTGQLRATPGRLTLMNVTGEALNAKLSGEANLIQGKNGKWKGHAEGNFDELGIRDFSKFLSERPLAWNGMAVGNFSADAEFGLPNANISVSAVIAPLPRGVPVEGKVELRYDEQTGSVRFRDTRLATPETSLTIAGTLGDVLDVRARTKNMDDVLPLIAAFSNGAPGHLPMKLMNGEAAASGIVSGPLDHLEFRGTAELTNASVEGHAFDRFTGNVHASGQIVELTGATVTRGATQISGDASLRENASGFSDGLLRGKLNFANLALAEVDKEFGVNAKVSGNASGSVELTGTLRDPHADVTADAGPVSGYGQTLDRLRARGRYTLQELEVRSGEADIGANKIAFAGTFHHPENDWTSGEMRGNFTTQGLPTQTIARLREVQPQVNARLDAKFDFDAKLESGEVSFRGLNGNGAAHAVTFRGAALGDLAVKAATQNGDVTLDGTAHLRDSNLTGRGQFRLDGNNAGAGTLRFSRMSVDTLHDLVSLADGGKTPVLPPFDGYVEGGATFNLALRDPSAIQAQITIDALEFRPRATQVLRLDVKEQDLQLRNNGPVLLDVTRAGARVRAGRFSARETNLEVTGQLPFTPDSGADFNVRGGVNLAILQLLNPDLLAKGTATVAASVRGSLKDPMLNGRMELMDASLYLADLPNGVDKANGVVLFDRNRATIERLTAETGGGQIAFHGSLEFGNALVYRLQAEARQVRVRYPEDVSLTASAQLALTGTSEASTLTGTLDLNRAAVSPGADLGRILAVASQPSPAPPDPNEYLRGMRFDVRIQSAPTFTLETSLTRNIQTEVDLRLRGTPLTPALVGTITASSGEVQMFGNRYTINRGDVRFLNPVKIEPLLDLDLETRARGIVVSVTVTGSPQKLNVNYSSDPPLQPREIIALLAVGRDPTAITENSQIAASTTSTGFGDAGGLLGEAVSEQLSNRLQRFFGSSRVKIDPTLTGVDALPSATYLTLQQQVSRDVTLTYTTNLNRTQEQIVRLEWNLNPRWSAVAVRDANGLFGVDFQYRKRFK